MRTNGLTKCIEIVSAFETRDDPALAHFIGPLHNGSCHRSVVRIFELQLSERIGQMRIEASGDENDIRFYFGRYFTDR